MTKDKRGNGSKRLEPNGRESFATADLPEETIEKIAASHMDPRHDHLNALLDEPNAGPVSGVLSPDDQLAFAKAIIDPPSPSPGLVEAAQRHRELIGNRTDAFRTRREVLGIKDFTEAEADVACVREKHGPK